LRGYETGAFIGDNLVLLATELRIPITPPAPVGLVGLNFFFDSGAVYDHGTSLRKARFRNGVGGGVYLFVAFIGFQVDAAYGLANEELHFHFSAGFRF
jgi:outer membrane protein assembly factor BamA